MAKKLAIIAPPRSGTLFISHFIQDIFDIRTDHEMANGDGIIDVDWKLPLNHRVQAMYRRVIFQTRNPLETISSLHTINWKGQRGNFQCFPDIKPGQDSLLLMSMKLYYHWSVRCESIADWSYKLEDVNSGNKKVVDKLCLYLGVKNPDYDKINEYCAKNSKINSRIRDEVKWSQLARESLEYHLKIQALAERYGYPTDNTEPPEEYTR